MKKVYGDDFLGGGKEEQRRKRMKIIMDKEKLFRKCGLTDLEGFVRGPPLTRRPGIVKGNNPLSLVWFK